MSTVPSANAAEARKARAWAVLHTVADPEIPVLSLCDLGIVRDVRHSSDGVLDVVLTPTYSGCPATELIARSVAQALECEGLGPVRISQQRAPAWSSDWISAEGLEKMRRYGIAPPAGDATAARATAVPVRLHRSRPQALNCPRCASAETEQLSAFGSTACKALWRCRACGEPFEYFKPI